ncbi:acyltransferase [Polynucleobacter paneuropaeus]|nr:acyltransferase [Polynucleobacter paneuropaeus]
MNNYFPEHMQTHNVVFANTLRGIAALLVLISHHWGLFWNDRAIAARFSGLPLLPEDIASPYFSEFLRAGIGPINLGALGVSIFFLISGFVIPFSLVKQTRSQFAITRFFRLWPTYFVGFLCTFSCIYIGTYLVDRPLPFPASAIWPHLILGLRGLIQSQSIDAIVWTLEIEIGFYFLIALTIQYVKRSSTAVFFTPLLLLILALFIGIFRSYIQEIIIYRYLQKLIGFSHFFIFMYIGVALNYYYKKQLNSFTAFLIIIGLLLASLTTNLATTNNLYEIGPSYLLGLIIFLAFMMMPALRNWSPRLAEFFSMISYPLYIIHAVIGYILLYFFVAVARVDPIFALLIVFVTVIALAFVIHYLIEVPSQSMGKSLAAHHL